MKLATRIFRRTDWYVTSGFGWRRDPISGANTMHSGCDYGVYNQKWPQYALENGVVLSAGVDVGGALFAWVRYPRLGKDLLHYHLDSVNVRAGQGVTANTIIGNTGTTGYSTGIHLHLGMRTIGSTAYEDPHTYEYNEAVVPQPVVGNKPIDTVAQEVISGAWGNDPERTQRLTAAGYDANAVQSRVNALLTGNQPTPQPANGDILDLVRRSIRGDFGNGQDRINALGANYAEVQRQIELNYQNGTIQWNNIRLY